MLIGSLTQLCGNVLETALAEQVHNPATGLHYPIGRAVPVNKSQHLDAPQQTVSLRPIGNSLNAILLAVGRSFNRYAVETLEEAVNPPEKKISLKGVLLDPEWYSFMIPSLDLTEEEIREDPRLSAILGL